MKNLFLFTLLIGYIAASYCVEYDLKRILSSARKEAADNNTEEYNYDEEQMSRQIQFPVDKYTKLYQQKMVKIQRDHKEKPQNVMHDFANEADVQVKGQLFRL